MPQVVALGPDGCDEAVRLASYVLSLGALVVLPTDTVYGLAARAFDQAAVEGLYTAKCRVLDKKVPLLIAEPELMGTYAPEASEKAIELARLHWPGALTIVVPAADELPSWLVDERGAVALRCPDHDFVRDVARELAEPLAVTSANLTGHPEARTVDELPAELLESVELLVDGGPAPAMPSTVVDCTGEEPVLLREGSVLLGGLGGPR